MGGGGEKIDGRDSIKDESGWVSILREGVK